MIEPKDFTDKQFELGVEFAQYVAAHPEVDNLLPEKSHICFQINGEPAFNRYSRESADRQQQEDGLPVVLVRTKGLVPPQGSRLIDPVIEPAATIS